MTEIDESKCLLLSSDTAGNEWQVPRCAEYPRCVCGGPEGLADDFSPAGRTLDGVVHDAFPTVTQ